MPDEQYIDLNDAARLVPCGTYWTVYRWTKRGLRHVVGGGAKLFTTREWLREFMERQNSEPITTPEQPLMTAPAPARKTNDREARILAAEKSLRI